ncbi:Aldo/keto reductase family-domain-containing protein [Podospora appendiculata]|uniref:Aldo/keto reductase family-domain-containing protein n=1 Tax=Podospora appendiculata TaxID=314037 RepID=A0AAE0X0A1_9PEZI|nr:Aldo/keto reductase family-domain-containing protein [Podospora appendiculata]
MESSFPPRPPLHSVLPPLILGTATFNTQYVTDPLSMPYRDIVARAIDLGVNCFDTSPYYGPSEILLGSALDALMNPQPTDATPSPVPLDRSSFKIVTKAGRIVMDEFDYSPAYIRYSVLRSLQRLHTSYVDLVYCHDVEFVSPAETLAAVRELRRLRDEEGVVRYVGISGFPVDVLCSLAEMVLSETGEPLDAVLSYGHFTIQNRALGLPWIAPDFDGRGAGSPLARLKAAGVGVVLNASILGMGLLTSRGIPVDPEPELAKDSPLAKWHPSPPELRLACKKLAALAAAEDERLESVAIRWALERWARVGAAADIGVCASTQSLKVGATVCGVSSIAELQETVAEWRGVMALLETPAVAEEATLARRDKVLAMVEGKFWPALGPWLDYVWASPGAGFVNTRREEDRGTAPDDGTVAAYDVLIKVVENSLQEDEAR